MFVYILVLGTVAATTSEKKIEIIALMFAGILFLWWANKDDKQATSKMEKQLELIRECQNEKTELEQKVQLLEKENALFVKEVKELKDKLTVESNKIRIHCPNCKKLLTIPPRAGRIYTGLHLKDGAAATWMTSRKTLEQEVKCPSCTTILHLDYIPQ